MDVATLKAGDYVEGQFLLADCKKGVKDNGANYWTMILQDNSGTIEAKKWDYLPEDEAVLVKGNVVQVRGDVLLYRTALQVKIRSVEEINQGEVDWSRFLATAPKSTEEMKRKLEAFVASIKDEDVRLLTKACLDEVLEDLLVYPAAVRNHHEYMGGLLYHSLTMADLAVEVCRVYPAFNRDLVLSGILLHDLGKITELSGVRGTSFTLEGKLLGHISIGHAFLRNKAMELGYYKEEGHKKEVAILLEHIVLSHHGKHEFGSPVLPLTREALVVSMIDDMDAKLMILEKALKPINEGDSTAKLFNLDDRYFYKPKTEAKEEEPGLSLEEMLADLQR